MDISQLLSSLTPEDMKNLQDMASTLFSSEEVGQKDGKAPPPKDAASSFMGADPGILSSLLPLISSLSSPGKDPRCQLITALKPLLSEERRRRADEAVRIIQLMDMLPLLRDSGIFKGLFGG